MTAPALPYLPIRIGPAESSLFGWFHPHTGPSRNTGVVLCGPIGDEEVRAHRALRRLAERLGDAGFSVLRFDFHGTGDSSGSGREPGRVKTWLRDIGLAVAELKARSGAAEIAIVGLRLGGTLAASFAASTPVDSLVLWNSYDSGTAYVHEVTRLHRMHKLLEPQSFASEPDNWIGSGEEALGFPLSAETVRELRKIDLLSLEQSPAKQVLVLDAENAPAASETKLFSHFGTVGGKVDHHNFPGQTFLDQVPHKAELPTAVLSDIMSWLNGKHPVRKQASSNKSVPSAAGATESEVSLVFGGTHPLFGILTKAKDTSPSKADRPAIIMLNAGCTHRIGPHRFYVSLARRFADLGFSALRMDLSGIGDSPAASGSADNLPYPPSWLDDVKQAMTALERATGATRFILLGHFTGADLAFQSALKNERVAGVMMLNPRTFGTYEMASIDSYKRARYYQRSLLRASSWKKALRGQVDFRRALGMLIPKFADLAQRRITHLLGQEGSESEVPDLLRLLAQRGVDLFIIATENDPGVYYVDTRFGTAMRSLESVHGYRREDFRGMDHTLTSLYAQEKIAQVLSEHLSTRSWA